MATASVSDAPCFFLFEPRACLLLLSLVFSCGSDLPASRFVRGARRAVKFCFLFAIVGTLVLTSLFGWLKQSKGKKREPDWAVVLLVAVREGQSDGDIVGKSA